MNFDILLCHPACRVKFHINEHCNDSLITYKKRILNLDDFNRVWIYLWKRMESFALSSFKCTGDHQLRICPSASWSFVPYPSKLVLFKQSGHIADYCKMSNDNNYLVMFEILLGAKPPEIFGFSRPLDAILAIGNLFKNLEGCSSFQEGCWVC